MAPGYSGDSIVVAAFESDNISAKSYLIPDINHFSLPTSKKLQEEISSDFPTLKNNPQNLFGLLLIDGMSFSEEQVIGSLAASLNQLPIIGGSAGDNLRFQKTFVYHDGEFHTNAATLILIETQHKFKLFQTQHFQATNIKLVVTEAEPQKRLVTEINGYPAAEEYARLIGTTKEKLAEETFSLHPVMLKVNGEYHVRSIQRVNDDDSLTFYCAIDTGLVMTIGKGKDIFDETRKALQIAANDFDNLALTIGCDCILRRLEAESHKLHHEMSSLFTEFQVLGFSTYGEQYNGVHINQTLTAIMLGD